ncbi:type II toxin-antitoxin system RelE family toxin [Methylobacterium sp. J-067]|uniref:type II toxin-antitoxin system RelE family toxin n=1 Tax=Methylobacterium sp. J-067 TaxID=2836648 RepID=UPI001FB94E53|nr:type II toxin-antitoxin system RelE/ParE family toxin [Methylobacterium sp. J-067]MCJ2026226.1 type II toxin-antitoxin system RelE/ParE family toxin [Methylobacterium sp. J-067]
MPQVVYSRDAIRTLSRMPANLARLIRTKMEQYAADPGALANNVKMLKGEPGVLRLRVGDWRVLFTEDGVVIAVIRIAPRGSVYDQ